ncbi:MAG: DinB family protein [Pseudomonadota bacterium]
MTPETVRLLARYTTWQNESQIKAMQTLDDAALRLDRGAFFRSILATANHLLWGDTMWLSRFAGTPAPPPVTSAGETTDLTPDLPAFIAARTERNAEISAWADGVTEIEGPLRWYSGMLGREMEKPLSLCILGFFNHGTHHRGQIHAMLTAAGVTPDDTDLFLMDLP